MSGYLYILKDKKGKFYVGSTNNIERRLQQHQNGHTQTTNRMEEPEPVLIQKFESLSKARKAERKIKRMKRKDYIEKIVQDGYLKKIE